MIPVAQNGVALVGLRPFVEIQMIVVGFLATVQQSNISSITRNPIRSHKSRNSGAGGLCAVRMAFTPSFSTPQPLFPNCQRHRRAERAAVRVQADAFDFEIFSVQPEAGIGLEMRVADAEGSRFTVEPWTADEIGSVQWPADAV